MCYHSFPRPIMRGNFLVVFFYYCKTTAYNKRWFGSQLNTYKIISGWCIQNRMYIIILHTHTFICMYKYVDQIFEKSIHSQFRTKWNIMVIDLTWRKNLFYTYDFLTPICIDVRSEI